MKPANSLLSLKPIGIAVTGIAIIAVAVYVFVTWLPGQQRVSQIESVFEESGQIQAVAEFKRAVSEPITEEVNRGGRKVKVITQSFDASDSVEKITDLGRNDHVLWPGNVIHGDGISSFIYRPIALQRAPITLSVSMESSLGTGGPLSITVSDPKLSSVRQGINDLLKGVFNEQTTVAARAIFDSTEIQDEFDLSIAIGADVKQSTVNLESKFDFTSANKTTKLFAKYQQIYYTVDIDAPETPADLFSPTLTAEQVERAIPAGSMPVYVSSVDYGMLAYIFIESSDTASKLTTALEVAYDTIATGGALEATSEAAKTLKSSTIKIVVYGGSTDSLSEVAGGYEGFINIIRSSTKFSAASPAVPLAYKFSNAADNTIAAVNLTSQYTTVTEMWGQPVQISITALACTEAWDDDGINDHQLELRDFEIKAEIISPIGRPVDEAVIFSTGEGYTIVQGDTHWSQDFDEVSATAFVLDTAIGTRDFNPKDYKLKISWVGTERDSSFGNTHDGFSGDMVHLDTFIPLSSDISPKEPQEFTQRINMEQALNNFNLEATIKVEFPEEE